MYKCDRFKATSKNLNDHESEVNEKLQHTYNSGLILLRALLRGHRALGALHPLQPQPQQPDTATELGSGERSLGAHHLRQRQTFCQNGTKTIRCVLLRV